MKRNKFMRLISSMLILVIVAGMLIPAMPISAVQPELTQGQKNIVKRARQMTEIQWKPLKDIKSWKGEITYWAGVTYTGLPYGQPVNKGSYVPWDTGLEEFLEAVNDPDSLMYKSRSENNENKQAPYYSTDCSAFVSWAWDLEKRQSTHTIAQFATEISTSSYEKAQVGDCLNKYDVHTVLITDIGYDESGAINSIEISEATTVKATNYCCQVVRYGVGSTKTLKDFKAKYFDDGYTLYRSNTRDSVTYEHSCAVPLEGDVCTKCGIGGYVSYPCAVRVFITEDCWPYSKPCDSDTAHELGYVSEKLEDQPISRKQILIADEICQNTKGELWYRVTLSDGTKAYLNSAYTEYDSVVLPWIEGGWFPNKITGTKSLQGDVTSGGSQLDTIQTLVCRQGSTEPVLQSKIFAVDKVPYPLKSSAVDNDTPFRQLQNYGKGYYTLIIKVGYTTYYAENNELKKDSPSVEVATYDFYFGTPAPQIATVTFDANGGNCVATNKVIAAGSAIGSLPTPTRSGYDFAGWYKAKDSFDDPIDSTTTISGDTTCYALWANKVYDGTQITFDAQGGTVPGATSTLEVTAINANRADAPVIIYNCGGIKVATDYSEREIVVDSTGKVVAKRENGEEEQLTVPNGGFVLSMRADAVEFYENADIGEYIGYYTEGGTTYVSHYDAYGAYLNNHTYMRRGDEYGCLPIPVKDGYLFDGWYTAASGGEDDGSKVVWDSDFTASALYAHWVQVDDAEPVDVKIDEVNNRRYERYDQSVSWEEAKAFCESQGGHLVTITSEQEQELVEKLLAGSERSQYYIGATDAQEEGSWTWVTGEAFEYSNWGQKQPEPSGEAGENYGSIIAEVRGSDKDFGEWNDLRNEDHNADDPFYGVCNTGFICEYEDTCRHKYAASHFDADCVTAEHTKYMCVVCGHYYEVKHAEALGHSFGDWYVKEEPTAYEVGIDERRCTRCGYTEQRDIPVWENPFDDVVFGSFYYEPVLWAVRNGITNGTTATTFSPNDQCMRAHVVTFLWRAMGSPEPQMMFNPFVDVPEESFYYKPVLWAVEKGITNGLSANAFGPNTACNRAQVVTFLYRAMGKPKVTETEHPFTDVAEDQFYYDAMLWAVEKGITNGLTATTFGPNATCNRAQIVTFLFRAINE